MSEDFPPAAVFTVMFTLTTFIMVHKRHQTREKSPTLMSQQVTPPVCLMSVVCFGGMALVLETGSERN